MSAAENMVWAGTLVAGLSGEGGLCDVVVSPGSRSTPLVLALDEHAGIRTHVVLDERSAAFFALGVSRASGRPVGLVCTSGSAAGHYLPAVIEADHSGVPLVILSADRPRELHGFGAGQAVDHVNLFGRHVRRFFDLDAPHGDAGALWLRTVAAQALDASQTGKGPVHINCRFRKPLWQPGATTQAEVKPARILRGKTSLDPAVVAALAERMTERPRGAIVVGPCWPDPGAGGVEALSCLLDWPVLAEACSQLRCGSPFVSTTATVVRDRALGEALRPDFVLRLGRLPTATVVQEWLAGVDGVLVDALGRWHDPGHGCDTLVVAEPGDLCRALVEILEPSPASGWSQKWSAADAAAAGALARCGTDDGVLWEGAVARVVAEAIPAGGLLHVASSGPIRDLDAFAPGFRQGVRVMHSRGANGIDGTLATACGEACAFGEPVVILLGDLAFRHDASSLALAVGMGIDATLVVVDNGGGGIFGQLPIARHAGAFERYFLTRQPGCVAEIAAGYGVESVSVTDERGLRRALLGVVAGSGVRVIRAVVDRAHSETLKARSWAAVAQAVRVALGLAGGQT